MTYMLDTNICIYAIKNKPEQVLRQLKANLQYGLCISAITLAELEHGVEKSASPEKNTVTLMQFLAILDVPSFDDTAAAEYGKICAYLQKRGTPMSRYDMAQMVYNSITAKGYQVTVDVGAIWTSTADWIFVPYQYRDAVAVTKTCGIINGMDEKGTFGGGLNMTRAQASVVLFGLYDCLANADSDLKMTYVGASKPNPGTGPDTGAGTGTGNTNPPGSGKGYTPASGVKASVGKNDQYPTKGSAAVPNKNGYYTAADIDFGDAKLVYELLDMVNQARAAEGHVPLKWVPMDAMEEYSLLRTYELETKWSHSRPSDLYNGYMEEIIAGTCKDSRIVFDAWMNSPGHRREIMEDDWTFMCAAKGGGSGAGPWIITFGNDWKGKLCEGGTYVNYTKQNGWETDVYWD